MTEMKTIRIASESVISAKRRAEKALKLPINELEFKIIQRESSGLIKKAQAIIECTFDPREQQLRVQEHELTKFIDLKILDKGIYLKVDKLPEELVQRAVIVLRRYLQRRNIFEVERILLKKLIDLGNGKYILIQKAQPVTVGKAHINIYVTSDRMTAILTRYDLEELPRGEFVEYLEKCGIRFGINEQVLSDLGNKKLLNRPVIIAEGKEAVTEIKAPLKYCFDPETFSVKFDENDSVDFKDLMDLTAVKKGTELAEKTDPIQGQSGKSIDGTEIPFDVERDGPIPHGSGVHVSTDGTRLVADIDGHIVFDFGIVSVEPIYVVQGDVDYHSGNVDFDGGVIVTGDILEGFSVKATGKVEVHGVIDGGIVETDGSLVVKQGIFSKSAGYVKIGGNLLAKHVESMKIEASAVRIHSNIINADIHARDFVEVFGHPGSIIGGTITAREYVKANTIGNVMGHKTFINVGNPDKVIEKEAATASLIKPVKEKLENVNNTIQVCQQRAEEEGNVAVTSDILVKAEQAQRQIQEEYDRLNVIMKECERKEARLKLSKVHFRNNIFEGVCVNIFTDKILIKETIVKGGSMIWENEEIKIIHYHFVEGE